MGSRDEEIKTWEALYKGKALTFDYKDLEQDQKFSFRLRSLPSPSELLSDHFSGSAVSASVSAW